MVISSPAFDDNGRMPKKHTGFGEDRSPELMIKDAPENAVSYAVICEDLDVPWMKDFTHWIIWNIPVVDVIPEGLPKGACISEPIRACQGMAYGRHCYRGPKIPFFLKKAHRYVFRVFALDHELTLSPQANKRALQEAMAGHVLAEAKLTGMYRR